MYIIVNQVIFKFDNSQSLWDLWKSSWWIHIMSQMGVTLNIC